MYELIQVSEHDFYLDCPSKAGIVLTEENEICFIDSGADKDAGKKLLRITEGKGWKLKAIYNTHSHADHIGGNRFLQDRTGCRVFAPGTEQAFTAAPFLEPAGLYGGFPFGDLRHKFLLAQESRAELLTPDVLPEGFEMISLPGHSFDMAGFLTPDGTFYAADCVSSPEVIAKYGISYLWDKAAFLETLEKIKGVKAEIFVPSHTQPVKDITELADINAEAVIKNEKFIEDACENGITFDGLLKKVFDGYSLIMNAQQYVLIGSTVRSYVSGLINEGRISLSFDNNTAILTKIN